MVIRMRSAAALSAARTTSTVTASRGWFPMSDPFRHVDPQAGVGLDLEPIARLQHGGGARLLDRGRPLDHVAGPQPVAPVDPVLEQVAEQGGVDLARLEGGRGPGAPR